jgi:hypothetical protein
LTIGIEETRRLVRAGHRKHGWAHLPGQRRPARPILLGRSSTNVRFGNDAYGIDVVLPNHMLEPFSRGIRPASL